jgi:hypothetical protein
MRAARECREELEWLIGQAIRHLESADLRGANEALKRANAAAATLDDNALPPTLETTNSSRTKGVAANDGATPDGGRKALGNLAVCQVFE